MSILEPKKTAGRRSSDMALLEVKRTPNGRLLARRKDGLPLTPKDRKEAKRLSVEHPRPCWNCGQSMTDTNDIYGKAWWACWSCAKWA